MVKGYGQRNWKLQVIFQYKLIFIKYYKYEEDHANIIAYRVYLEAQSN